MNNTVIIANRGRGRDFWINHFECPETEANEWIVYFRNRRQVAKVFPSLAEYRADCERLRAKWEAERFGKHKA